MCIVTVCSPGCDVINFEISLIFLIEMFSMHVHNIKTKVEISGERKELLR